MIRKSTRNTKCHTNNIQIVAYKNNLRKKFFSCFFEIPKIKCASNFFSETVRFLYYHIEF